ncbi:hypothetical protein HMPREF0880_04401 [Yokenella regensburgei ATCC 43003]|nr:hypothetical protein HMPREF0880_04401 [Yokenella regensburgei ATCC 43003]
MAAFVKLKALVTVISHFLPGNAAQNNQKTHSGALPNTEDSHF